MAAICAGALLAPAAALTACSGSAPAGNASGSGSLSVGAATGTPVALGSGPAAALQQQYEEVIKAALPSVVQINTDAGTGSGVIYDTKGDIVTNAYVVGDATTVEVLPAAFGPSASVTAGQIVLAMGNPLGLTGSVTQGIISATVTLGSLAS
jgi:S1-C subfamily serine protease